MLWSHGALMKKFAASATAGASRRAVGPAGGLRRAAEIDFLLEPTAAYISCVVFPTCHLRVSRFEQRCNYFFFSFFLFLNSIASSGCSGLRLDPNSASRGARTPYGELRMQWATPGPEHMPENAR